MNLRESAIRGFTQRIPTPVGTAFVTISGDGSGPKECFINVGKAGSDIQADAEAIGRLISLVLCLPDGMTAQQRIEAVIEQIGDIGGARQGYEAVKSLPDGVAHALGGLNVREKVSV